MRKNRKKRTLSFSHRDFAGQPALDRMLAGRWVVIHDMAFDWPLAIDPTSAKHSRLSESRPTTGDGSNPPPNPRFILPVTVTKLLLQRPFFKKDLIFCDINNEQRNRHESRKIPQKNTPGQQDQQKAKVHGVSRNTIKTADHQGRGFFRTGGMQRRPGPDEGRTTHHDQTGAGDAQGHGQRQSPYARDLPEGDKHRNQQHRNRRDDDLNDGDDPKKHRNAG